MFQRDPTVLGRTPAARRCAAKRDRCGPIWGGLRLLQILSAADYSPGSADRDPRSRVDIALGQGLRLTLNGRGVGMVLAVIPQASRGRNDYSL
jgi:hypothetical protein